ncbi:MAG: ABC transporter ATP-binding protein [Alphaproteobacteria bacterium]|nr:ABC transporter ATP-binding protein [Alphaproteobacteria bacterium]
MNNQVPVLELKNVKRSFIQGENSLEILKGISLQVHPGEVVALVGPSGSGKTTMLQIAGLLEKPTHGQVLIQGQAAENLNDNQRTKIRCQDIGFVYQFHHLLPDFSALENVVMPQIIQKIHRQDAEKRAIDLIEKMGLKHRLDHRPTELSGGEQQRIAIARALANHPKLLLADEPTGNLDSKTAETVFAELTHMAKDLKVGALIATHNPDLAARMDRIIVIVDGILQG